MNINLLRVSLSIAIQELIRHSLDRFWRQRALQGFSQSGLNDIFEPFSCKTDQLKERERETIIVIRRQNKPILLRKTALHCEKFFLKNNFISSLFFQHFHYKLSYHSQIIVFIKVFLFPSFFSESWTWNSQPRAEFRGECETTRLYRRPTLNCAKLKQNVLNVN